MSDLEKLIDDYYRDQDVMAEQMIAWCTPTKELMAKILKYKKKSKAWRKRKGDNEKFK